MEGRESLMKDPRYPIADRYFGEHGTGEIAAHASMAELRKYLAALPRRRTPKTADRFGGVQSLSRLQFASTAPRSDIIACFAFLNANVDRSDWAARASYC